MHSQHPPTATADFPSTKALQIRPDPGHTGRSLPRGAAVRTRKYRAPIPNPGAATHLPTPQRALPSPHTDIDAPSPSTPQSHPPMPTPASPRLAPSMSTPHPAQGPPSPRTSLGRWDLANHRDLAHTQTLPSTLEARPPIPSNQPRSPGQRDRGPTDLMDERASGSGDGQGQRNTVRKENRGGGVGGDEGSQERKDGERMGWETSPGVRATTRTMRKERSPRQQARSTSSASEKLELSDPSLNIPQPRFESCAWLHAYLRL